MVSSAIATFIVLAIKIKKGKYKVGIMSEIDVSKCRHFNMSEECRAMNNELCKDIKYCHYKHLQHLKEYCKQIDDTNRILYQEKCELIKENEELKEKFKINCINKFFDLVEVLDEIEKICHENKEELNYLKDEYNFALVILQKIKEVRGNE